MKAVDQMKHRRTMLSMAVILFALTLLTGCADQTFSDSLPQEETYIADDSTDDKMDNIPAESEELNEENSPDTQQDVSVDDLNQDILTAGAGTTVTQTIETTAGGVLSIDAQVDVDGISRVSCYRYIPQEFTEESRKALFKRMFPAESWDVNEAAMYNEEEEAWEIATPLGESWVCQVRDSRIVGEQIINIERVDIALDYEAESDVSPIRLPNTPYEDMLLLIDIIDSKPSLIEQIGQVYTASVMEESVYSCNYIYICGEDGGLAYAKAVFKQTVDGMPVTAWHNYSTATSNVSHFPVKVWGSFYSMEEIGLTETILTPTEAVAAMQEQIDSIQMQETQMCITKISLEYLAVISSDGQPYIVPVWRFWLGNDEIERTRMCEQIFAVNAVSGELIWENREVF